MKSKNFKEYLKELKEEAKNYNETKDNQSYIYIYQLTDLFYSELSTIVLDQKVLNDSIYNNFRKNILEVFDKLKDYINKTRNIKEKDINELLKLCLSNDYFDQKNLNNIYSNFEKELKEALNVDKKITTSIETNFDIFKGDLYSKTVILKKDTASKAIERYKKLYITELINNLNFKKNNILAIYKNFINNVMSDIYEEKRKIRNKNLIIISNVSYDYLQKAEFSTVDKYTKENKKLINSFFIDFEKYIKEKKIATLKIKKNKAKEYLLDFNLTLNSMIKNVFEEMNDIVSLDNEVIRTKLKDFNELITHIFEINLIFDKQFNDYKNSFLIKNNDKFDKEYEKRIEKFISEIKNNIFNVFRDNTKVYNDILYKTMLLKNSVSTYDEVITITKAKDLLLG